MPEFTIYDTATGRINRVNDCNDAAEAALNTKPGENFVQSSGAEWKTDYVTGGSVIERPSLPAITNNYNMNELPPGGKLIITDPFGFETEVLAQNDVLTFIDAGTYTVRSELPFPWINGEWSVEI